MADQRTGSLESASRRDFLTRAFPRRVAALLGSSVAAATGAAAAQTPADEASARDLRKMSRDEVRDALRRIRARRRAD
jgi:hypothetical protein